jgi:alpha-amylase
VSRLKLCLAIHNHQPVGNFGAVFEKAYDDCYRPFVDALERHPRVRLSLHYTGPLLEWFARFRPDFLARLRALAGRGQVEILGGGLFEPILAVLPERDALAQIAGMRDFCARELGCAPDGLWLAERAWEPDLPRVLARAGVRFSLLDDTAFLHAGIPADELYGHFITEKAGATVALFPIDRRMRYLIPFREPEELVATLRELHGRGQRSVTYGDDGEKFGLWPGTKEWVYGKGWLERFLGALEACGDFLELSHFAEALADPPAGRVYLPTASYEEMMEWALPARAQAAYDDFRHTLEREGRLDAVRPWVRGGIWQGFLAKYPESNALHKRMLLVSERVERAARVAEVAGTPEALALAEEARTHLYRGQCNDPYWHGLFGGLYSRHLRGAAYQELLRAQSCADRLLPDGAELRIARRDYDCDGAEEILVDSPVLAAIVSPARGGAVTEIDYLPRAVNITDVLARRVEGYHRKVAQAFAQGSGADAPRSIHDLQLAKEAGLERYLVADRHGRHAFVQHLLDPDTGFEEAVRGKLRALSETATSPWRVVEACAVEGEARVHLERADGIAALAKRIFLRARGEIEASFSLAATGEERPVLFAVEVNFALPAEAPAQCYFDLGAHRPGMREPGQQSGVRSLLAVDEHTGLEIAFATSWPAEVWRFPVETVSQSEEGFERTFQGCAVLFLWRGGLRREAAQELRITLGIRERP